MAEHKKRTTRKKKKLDVNKCNECLWNMYLQLPRHIGKYKAAMIACEFCKTPEWTNFNQVSASDKKGYEELRAEIANVSREIQI